MASAVTYGTMSASDHSAQLRKAVIAATVGTTIEWYDFFIYGTAAGLVFGKLYFPNSDPLTATLAAFGTYFIGYSRSPHTIEQMLENMFVGRPPGNYDRLLDFSRAVTGNLFFAPSVTFLEAIGEEPAAVESSLSTPQPTPRQSDGSLGIGSLKGEISDE